MDKKEMNRRYRETHREQIKIQQKEFYEKNRDKIIERNSKYNQEHKEQRSASAKKYREKLIQEGRIVLKGRKKKVKSPDKAPKAHKNSTKAKTVVAGRTSIPSRKNIYLDSVNLTKQTILSQGRGKVSYELFTYWKRMIDEISVKFTMSTENMEDAKQNCIITLYLNLQKYNGRKYSDAFPYWTEVIKREFVGTHRNWNRGKQDLSLTNLYL